MLSVTQRLAEVRASLPKGVELVAISKYHPVEALREAYEAGQRVFGENHIVEMTEKAAALPTDIRWHFTGHVQTNKIRLMAPYVDTVESVDSLHVLEALNRHAERYGRVINCLLQIHVAQEETKYGLTPDECFALLNEGSWRQMKHVRITGLMAMATNTDDEQQVRSEFRRVRELFVQIKNQFFAEQPSFCVLSEGMTDDYLLAVAEGSNTVRIGSAIFGPRQY